MRDNNVFRDREEEKSRIVRLIVKLSFYDLDTEGVKSDETD